MKPAKQQDSDPTTASASAPRSPQGLAPVRRPSHLGSSLLVAGLVVAMVLPHYLGLGAHQQASARAAILAVFVVSSWALGLLKEPLPTLLFFLFCMLFAVVPARTVFAGFTSDAWWLVFGGAITGIAVRTTGLAERFSEILPALKVNSYRSYVTACVIGALALSFVMPSTTARVLLLTPIALTLADRLGLAPGRPGRSGLVMAIGAASYMPSTTVLPANVPNSVLLGAAQSLYGVQLHFGPYFLLQFPVMGLLKTVVLTWLIWRLFPDHVEAGALQATVTKKLSAREMTLIGILLLSLLCYATDSWHGISPAWVSFGGGLACLLPQTRIVSGKEFAEQMHIGPLLYIAGVLGLGALISYSGLGAWAAHALLDWTGMTPEHPLGNAVLLLLIGGGIGLLTTFPGLPAVLTPIAGELARASGLPLYTVLMLQVPVFGMVFLPYQAPPMLIALHLGEVPLKDGVKFCLILAAISVVFLLPLDYFWWHVLGVLH